MPSEQPDPNADYKLPPHQLATWVVLGLAVVLVASLFGVRFKHQPQTTRDYPSRAQVADAAPVLLPGPEISDDYLPCSDCHEGEPTNPTRRQLEEEHETRSQEFVHGTIWCLHCHDADDRDHRHLSDGTLVEFDDSWKLCGQCHAKKIKEWRAGMHGKRIGHWRGPKQYYTCVKCHDPHSPHFKPIVPKPPPLRPEEIVQPSERREAGIANGAHHEDS